MLYATLSYVLFVFCCNSAPLQEVCTILSDEVQVRLKHWQKEHFPKSQLPLQASKKPKQYEQEFEQAQKVWAKRLKKMQQHRKEYYHACKMERYSLVQVQNSKSELSGNTENVSVRVKPLQLVSINARRRHLFLVFSVGLCLRLCICYRVATTFRIATALSGNTVI